MLKTISLALVGWYHVQSINFINIPSTTAFNPTGHDLGFPYDKVVPPTQTPCRRPKVH